MDFRFLSKELEEKLLLLEKAPELDSAFRTRVLETFLEFYAYDFKLRGSKYKIAKSYLDSFLSSNAHAFARLSLILKTTYLKPYLSSTYKRIDNKLQDDFSTLIREHKDTTTTAAYTELSYNEQNSFILDGMIPVALDNFVSISTLRDYEEAQTYFSNMVDEVINQLELVYFKKHAATKDIERSELPTAFDEVLDLIQKETAAFNSITTAASERYKKYVMHIFLEYLEDKYSKSFYDLKAYIKSFLAEE